MPPFLGETDDLEDLIDAILHKELFSKQNEYYFRLAFPTHQYSIEFEQLLKKFLERDPNKRITLE